MHELRCVRKDRDDPNVSGRKMCRKSSLELDFFEWSESPGLFILVCQSPGIMNYSGRAEKNNSCRRKKITMKTRNNTIKKKTPDASRVPSYNLWLWSNGRMKRVIVEYTNSRKFQIFLSKYAFCGIMCPYLTRMVKTDRRESWEMTATESISGLATQRNDANELYPLIIQASGQREVFISYYSPQLKDLLIPRFWFIDNKQ